MFVNGSKRNEHSLQKTFYRCFLSSFISFGQAKSCFRNRPIRNKNCLWRPCLLMDQNGISNSHRGPSIQMLPTTFRSIFPSCFRVEDFYKSTNQIKEFPVVAMFVNGSGRNEQSLQSTFHRCFLPSFGSFSKAVSEEKIFSMLLIQVHILICTPIIKIHPPITEFFFISSFT